MQAQASTVLGSEPLASVHTRVTDTQSTEMRPVVFRTQDRVNIFTRPCVGKNRNPVFGMVSAYKEQATSLNTEAAEDDVLFDNEIDQLKS